jgi:hypothetical protein
VPVLITVEEAYDGGGAAAICKVKHKKINTRTTHWNQQKPKT